VGEAAGRAAPPPIAPPALADTCFKRSTQFRVTALMTCSLLEKKVPSAQQAQQAWQPRRSQASGASSASAAALVLADASWPIETLYTCNGRRVGPSLCPDGPGTAATPATATRSESMSLTDGKLGKLRMIPAKLELA
jgi:hypothetical protein